MTKGKASRRFGRETQRGRERAKKIEKLPKSLLTPEGAAAYIRLTNEGGAPLATRKFALVNGKNQESRVSDTRPGQSQKRYGP